MKPKHLAQVPLCQFLASNPAPRGMPLGYEMLNDSGTA